MNLTVLVLSNIGGCTIARHMGYAVAHRLSSQWPVQRTTAVMNPMNGKNDNFIAVMHKQRWERKIIRSHLSTRKRI